MKTPKALPGVPDQPVDPKTQLNVLCQKLSVRPVTKGDVTYTTTSFGFNQFQSIVKLGCLENQEFAGEVKASAKEAERSAALIAVEANADRQLESAAARKRRSAAAQGADGDDLANPAVTDKVRLNTMCMKIAKRGLMKGETVYRCQRVGVGTGTAFQATVQMKCLPGAWAEQLIAGEVRDSRVLAEQAAAAQAMLTIAEDPELSALVEDFDSKKTQVREEAQRKKGSGKGKEKGKGKFGDWDTMWKAVNEMWSQMESTWKNGKERVLETPIDGEVVDWKGNYGWVRPAQPVDHPAARLHGGKIFLGKNDVPGGEASLPAGAKVRFQVYVDPSGLGADSVELL